MARRAHIPLSEREEGEKEMEATRSRRGRVPTTIGSLSPSPAASFSSDKENRSIETESARQISRKSSAMSPQKMLTPTSAEPSSPRSSKRRRLAERDVPNPSQRAHQKELQETGNAQFYDPDQSMEERRAVRKEIRDLSKELNESRAEYLAPGSDGIFKTLQKANEIFASVKQTSDATLDSRLLVSAADLSTKRATQLNLGDASQGIDVDEFVGKCITFMRRGPGDERSNARRRRRQEGNDEEESGADGNAEEEDIMNWEWLGRQACFPYNLRPPVPGFLLGPLSVQKRFRKQTQRRERLQKRDPRDAVRPEELKAKDMQKVENSNLTTLCKNIRELLVDKMVTGTQGLEQEDTDDMSPEELKATMAKHGLADDGGVPFFQFVINPRSFGQTVENLFYVSFLIRDGTAGIGNDVDRLPTLHATLSGKQKDKDDTNNNQAHAPAPAQTQETKKHQAVFHLDYDTWEDLIDAFDITESIIPHRQSDEQAPVRATGWYA